MPLPLLLTGPMLRRVEPGLVSVFVAFSQPGTVTLSVWSGITAAGSGSGLFNGPTPTFTSVPIPTMRVGANLHVAAVICEPSPGLQPGQLYSYNITYAGVQTEDLKSLGLLRGSVPLGYVDHTLPSFATCPAEIRDLKIIQGSCRKPGGDGEDAMVWIDQLIDKHRATPLARPHQLFLTGDQIYADDVPMIHMMGANALAQQIVGREHVPWRSATDLVPCDLDHFPAGLRQRLMENAANFTSSEASSHALSFGEFCALYLLAWSPDVWPATLPGVADAFPTPTGPLHDIWKLHTDNQALSTVPGWLAEKRRQLQTDQKERDGFQKLRESVQKYKSAAAYTRRALANIPTYMQFDDHEVTDDWNLSKAWRDRVLASPLGVTVLRNGLLAYALFQALGNDPKRFTQGPHAEMLTLVQQLVHPPGGPHRNPANRLDQMLGLDGAATPELKWHYTVQGARHLVYVLDPRTRRHFGGRYSPPGLLSPSALQEQIPPGPLPAGMEVLFVVAPAPVLGPPVLEEVFQPLGTRVLDVYGAYAKTSASVRGYGAEFIDAEAWALDPPTFEALLARLAPYKRVIFLSGDVHFGFSAGMSYWRQNDPVPSRILQFCSSALKNAWPSAARAAFRVFAPLQALLRATNTVEKLGWAASTPSPISVPQSVTLVAPIRHKLQSTPVIVQANRWPPGTAWTRVPDWRWRMIMSQDERPDSDRPEAARPVPLPGEVDLRNAPADGYLQVGRRHQASMDAIYHSRQILWDSNVGVVTFATSGPGNLVATHTLYSLHERQADRTGPEPYTVHALSLMPLVGEQPPVIDTRSGGES